MRGMASGIVTFESEYMRERAKIVAEAKRLVDDARASLKKAHRHDGWRCKERETINDSLNEVSSKVDKIGAGLEQLSSGLNGGADRFAELEERAANQENALSADMLKGYSFEGKPWVLGESKESLEKEKNTDGEEPSTEPEPEKIPETIPKELAEHGTRPPVRFYPLPVRPIPPWGIICPIRPPVRIGIPLLQENIADLPSDVTNISNPNISTPTITNATPEAPTVQTTPVFEQVADSVVSDPGVSPASGSAPTQPSGATSAQPIENGLGNTQTPAAQSTQNPIGSIGYSYSPGYNGYNGYNGSYGSYFRGSDSGSGSGTGSLDMMRLILAWLSSVLGMSDSRV
jgi:hypothetical protein